MGYGLLRIRVLVRVSVNVQLLRDSDQRFLHALIDGIEGGQCIGDAHEGKGKTIVFSFECFPKDILIESVCLTHQPLHTVAVNCMTKTFLGHRHQNRHQRLSTQIPILPTIFENFLYSSNINLTSRK